MRVDRRAIGGAAVLDYITTGRAVGVNYGTAGKAAKVED